MARALGDRFVLGVTSLVTILSLAIAGCGSSDSTTVTVQKRTADTAAELAPVSYGPQLGDGCTAETAIATEVEATTVRGPLQCREVRRVMEIYFANAGTNGVGSGAGLEVGSWACVTAPPPEQPLAGYCKEAEGAQREFEMYSIGLAFRPGNRNVDCHLPPPDGAGQSNLRATSIDCAAASMVLGLWLSRCTGKHTEEACSVGDGVRCATIELGYELSQIRCRGRNDQLVTFETGA
jgi:hypothetical protein